MSLDGSKELGCMQSYKEGQEGRGLPLRLEIIMCSFELSNQSTCRLAISEAGGLVACYSMD